MPERHRDAVVDAVGHVVHRGRVEQRALGERAVRRHRVGEVHAPAAESARCPPSRRRWAAAAWARAGTPRRPCAGRPGSSPPRARSGARSPSPGDGVLEVAQLGRGVVLGRIAARIEPQSSEPPGAAYTGRRVQVAEQIRADVTAAMKAGDRDRVDGAAPRALRAPEGREGRRRRRAGGAAPRAQAPPRGRARLPRGGPRGPGGRRGLRGRGDRGLPARRALRRRAGRARDRRGRRDRRLLAARHGRGDQARDGRSRRARRRQDGSRRR